MPGFDKTGPEGLGAGTGRGLGPCGAGLRRGARPRLGRKYKCRIINNILNK